ncbi:hypothetical protein LTR28_007244 [Elasticomyces elasticus]|nr:hypothetical protein LTR28_007244 [Elasticomyces elasticus]
MPESRSSQSAKPVSELRLKQIATDVCLSCPTRPYTTETAIQVCESTLSTADTYTHSSTPDWNSAIIQKILKSLISETSHGSEPPNFKYAVNSTIIQHLYDGRAATDGEVEGTGRMGRRGMHSATGAYWNNEKDGMWSFKWEGGEAKGMDVVISLMWIAI